jgi:alpha 1,2-mannosyltransferase
MPNYGRYHEMSGEKYRSNNTVKLRSNNGGKFSSQSKMNQHKDVIVYLAQFGKYHTSYGFQQNANRESITGLSKLNQSLELLYTNYIDSFPSCDILIFFDADHGPDNETMAELRQNRPQLQFRELNGNWWELPHGLKAADRFQWNRPAFSVGYRHMIRWFAILIWKYLAQEGYSHVMRMDDDSYLHSKIDYNIFDYMRNNNRRYGFRMPVLEEAVGVGYDVIIDEFLNVNPKATSQELIDSFMKERYVGFYNNWFIADISFFLTPPASLLLDLIDQTDIIYTQRTGDLVIHSTAVRLFLRPDQIRWFRDFTYEHMTLCRKERCGAWVTNGCPQNGGEFNEQGYIASFCSYMN